MEEQKQIKKIIMTEPINMNQLAILIAQNYDEISMVNSNGSEIRLRKSKWKQYLENL